MTQLPAGWVEVTIDSLGVIVTGSTPSTKRADYWNGDIPFVTPGDLAHGGTVSSTERTVTQAGASKARSIPVGSVMVTCIGRIGRASLANTQCVTNQQINSIVPAGCVDGKYLMYALCSPQCQLQLQKLSSATTVAIVNKGRFSSVRVPLAPLAEQQRIVEAIEEQCSRLDAAQQSIQSARQRCGVLRTSLMRMLEGGACVPLGELLTQPLINGHSVRTSEDGSGFPVLRLTALRDGLIDLAQRKRGAWERREAERYIVRYGDFFVSRGNGSLALVGRGGLVDNPPDDVAFPDTMIRVRVDPTRIDPHFLRWIWDGFTVRRQIESAARTTAGIYKVNQQDLVRVQVPTPSIEAQRALVAELERLTTIMNSLASSTDHVLERARWLRSAILQSAFSGTLVPQDPEDEPASTLLERTAVEPSDRRQSIRGPKSRQKVTS